MELKCVGKLWQVKHGDRKIHPGETVGPKGSGCDHEVDPATLLYLQGRGDFVPISDANTAPVTDEEDDG